MMGKGGTIGLARTITDPAACDNADVSIVSEADVGAQATFNP